MARAGGQDYDSLTEYSVFVVITDDEGPPNLNPQAQKVDFKTVDLTKLVITLLGNATVYMDTMVDEADVLLGYNEYVNAGATADDTNAAGGGGMNLDGSGGTNATANITVLNPVNPKLPARYTITYNVADASGNQADEVTRTVIVRGKWGPEVRGTANDINDVVPTANGGTCCRWYKSCEIENVAFQCMQAEIDACAAVGQYFRDAKCNLCLQCDGYSGLDRKKIVSTKPADSSTDSLGREACIPSQEASVSTAWRSLLNTGGTGWPEHSSNIRKSTLDPGFSSHVTPKLAVCSEVDFICIQNTDVTTGKCLPKSDSEIQSAVGKARNAIQSNALQLKARQQAEDKVCVFC